jgi:hypothetical protein
VSRSLRRLAYPLRLAAARLAAGGRRLLLVAIGIVAGAAVLAAVLAGRLVMEDRALQQAAASLPPEDRTVAVAWSGTLSDFPALDRFVSARMTTVLGEQPVAAMLFREASIQRRLVNVRAADHLDRYVRLLSGRLPRPCTPQHCEVLRLEGTGPIPSTRYLDLIEVGRAVLKPGTPFAPFVLPAPHTEEIARAVRYHTPQPSPVVIANGVAGLTKTKELETFYRAYAWFSPVGGSDVHPWALGGFSSRVERLSAAIEAGTESYQVTAPTDSLAGAADAARAASRRLLLLGGEGGVLLLAFTVLTAAALRRDVADARRRLQWHGARRFQVELQTLAESLALGTAGTIVGFVAGGAAAAVIARRAGSPVADVLEHALLSSDGVLTGLGIAAGAGLLLYAAVRSGTVQLGRLALTPLDVAALGAIGVVLVGWWRGSVDAPALASHVGTSAFLLLVPALVVFAAMVAAARLLAPGLRALGRAGRRGPVALRLAAASLARNPGHAAAAATFLVASVGLALFTVAYRATLRQGQVDEARYAVPADYVLREDLTQLVPVLHGAGRLPARATPVVRLSGQVSAGTTFGFLALPARALPRIDGWRHEFSTRPRTELAGLLNPRPARLRTLALPPGRTFTLPVTGSGDDVGVRGFFRSRLGDYAAIPLGQTHAGTRVLLHGRIPFAGATLARLELDILNNGRLTANAGTGIQPSAKGIVELGMPRVNGHPVRGAFSSWIGTGGIGGTSARLGYVLTPDRTGVFRPRQATDGVPLPVLVTPAVASAAGPNGIVPLVVEGEPVAGHVVGVVKRFPSIVGDAVVADLAQAATRLDTASPGLGTTSELWLNSRVPPSAPSLTVASQAGTLHDLRTDPLARGALIALAGTAVVALLLALVGLLLSVVGDVRDDRGELFDLEAQGAAPRTIRAHLRLRALLVAVFGIVGGALLGIVLSKLVLALVTVTAGAVEPEPPLRLVLDARLVALGALVYVAAAALLVAVATSLRGRAPARAAEVGA